MISPLLLLSLKITIESLLFHTIGLVVSKILSNKSPRGNNAFKFVTNLDRVTGIALLHVDFGTHTDSTITSPVSGLMAL
jgi:hypothetical protein